MNQEIKTKWLRSLRNGDYLQGREELRTENNEFCCLGVLCDLIDPAGWVNGVHYGKDGYPTMKVLEAAGIPYDGNDNNGYVAALAEMNDDKGYNFDEIADWIEDNL